LKDLQGAGKAPSAYVFAELIVKPFGILLVYVYKPEQTEL